MQYLIIGIVSAAIVVLLAVLLQKLDNRRWNGKKAKRANGPGSDK